MKRMLSFILAITIMSGFAINSATAKSKIKLNKSSTVLKIGKTLQLKVKGTNAKVKWSSSNKSIATVSAKGKVTAKKAGNVKIFAKVNNQKLVCKIKIKAKKISLSYSALSLLEGEKVTVTLKNAVSKVKWSSKNNNIATVTQKGVVTAVNKGTTSITATHKGTKYTCIVKVYQNDVTTETTPIETNPIETTPTNTTPVETVPTNPTPAVTTPTEPTNATNPVDTTVNPNSITLNNANPPVLHNGETYQLTATISPENTTNKNVYWSSSNPDIASVNELGLVTAKSAGTVTITASTVDADIRTTATIRVNQTTSYISDGTYCFKLKGTNSYMDHQGGTTNGTNIHIWNGDGNSNNNQKYNIQRIDDNRYMLWSATSNNLLVDLNRGSSYSDPIEIGKNIDLWQNNDWEAQEWLFTKTYDGYYIIRLNTLQSGAIEAGGINDGDNIYLGTYNPENDRQKWELVNTSAVVIPETTAWVCNTAEVGNVNVRSGPGTNYASIGGFNEGQQVTIIGDTSAEWLKVRGADRHTGATIEGYSHRDYYTINPPSTPTPSDPLQAKIAELKTRFVNGQYWNKYNSADGSRTGTTPCYCSNTCIATCACQCGGYDNAWQCHGYALRIGYELFGSSPRTWSKAYTLDNLQPGDIIRYLNDGHTVVVTEVSGDTVTITDCNWIGPCKVRWDAQMSKSQFTGLTYVMKHP